MPQRNETVTESPAETCPCWSCKVRRRRERAAQAEQDARELVTAYGESPRVQ